MSHQKCIIVFGLAAAGYFTMAQPVRANSELLFRSGHQTQSDAGPGTRNYLGVDQDFSVGINFTLTQTVSTTDILGLFKSYDSASVFATVAPVNSLTPDLSGLAADEFTLLTVPAGGVSYVYGAPLSRVLQPGSYALVFGTVGHGGSGSASTLSDPDYVTSDTTALPYGISTHNGSQIFQLNSAIATALIGTTLNTPGAGIQLIDHRDLNGGTLIDFETGTTALPDVPGVHFLNTYTPVAGQPIFDGESGSDDTLFGQQTWENLESTRYTDLGMTFDTPVSELGFWIKKASVSNAPDTVTLNVYDTQGNLLYQTPMSIPQPDLGPLFVGLDSQTPIGRVEWLGGNSGFFDVDNVSFRVVPEPGTAFALLLCGGLVLLRRRRCSQSVG